MTYTAPMQIRANDQPEQAFTEAYEAFADPIFRHCAFRLFHRERAKEIMQETFVRAWEYVAGGKNIDNVRAFLYRTANNLVVDEIRVRVSKPEQSLDALLEAGFEPGDDNDAKAMAAKVDIGRIRDALAAVDEPYRSALVMRYIDGLPPAEIAEITGESANAISVRLNRGVTKLKDIIGV